MSYNRKRILLGAAVLLIVLGGLAYAASLRPIVVLDSHQGGVYVINDGATDALVNRVDGFWYYGGKVAMLANIPAIRQRIEAGQNRVKLDIPKIPPPHEQGLQFSPCFMKLVVRYGMPGIPIFRYAESLHFRYDSGQEAWAYVKSIPPKYRSLGKLAMGNVGKIKLHFQ